MALFQCPWTSQRRLRFTRVLRIGPKDTCLWSYAKLRSPRLRLMLPCFSTCFSDVIPVHQSRWTFRLILTSYTNFDRHWDNLPQACLKTIRSSSDWTPIITAWLSNKSKKLQPPDFLKCKYCWQKNIVNPFLRLSTKNARLARRVGLLNSEIDAIALLKGQRIFTLQLQNSKVVVGKVEKGYEFLSTANNCCLQIFRPILTIYNSRQLIADLILLCYTNSTHSEILGVGKKFTNTSTTNVIVTCLLSKKFLLKKPHKIANQPIRISSIASTNERRTKLQKEDLNTSILVRGLNIQYS